VNGREQAFMFKCEQDELCGILHYPLLLPEQDQVAKRGILVVVGGPQYRVGSHRQFVLLARFLADQGIPVMRFDYRGIGDSKAKPRTFESIDIDIHCAIDTFLEKMSGMNEVVIWGLCDAASAASFYAPNDPRVTGLVLLNPWVRTEAGIAKAYLKHYYLARLVDRSFWRKLIHGEFEFILSIKSLMSMIASSLGLKIHGTSDEVRHEVGPALMSGSLPERMLAGLKAYRGRVLFILSGDDLTADEFRDVVNSSEQWQSFLREPHVDQYELAEANHTFSRRVWRDRVAGLTSDWLNSW